MRVYHNGNKAHGGDHACRSEEHRAVGLQLFAEHGQRKNKQGVQRRRHVAAIHKVDKHLMPFEKRRGAGRPVILAVGDKQGQIAQQRGEIRADENNGKEADGADHHADGKIKPHAPVR